MIFGFPAVAVAMATAVLNSVAVRRNLLVEVRRANASIFDVLSREFSSPAFVVESNIENVAFDDSLNMSARLMVYTVERGEVEMISTQPTSQGNCTMGSNERWRNALDDLTGRCAHHLADMIRRERVTPVPDRGVRYELTEPLMVLRDMPPDSPLDDVVVQTTEVNVDQWRRDLQRRVDERLMQSYRIIEGSQTYGILRTEPESALTINDIRRAYDEVNAVSANIHRTRDEILAGFSAIDRDRARARKAADKTARELFIQFAGEEAYETLQSGRLPIRGSEGGTYVMLPKEVNSVESPDGMTRYCVTVHGVPLYDSLLATKMLVETDEKQFLAIANISGDRLRVCRQTRNVRDSIEYGGYGWLRIHLNGGGHDRRDEN